MLRAQVIQEELVGVIGVQLLKFLVDFALEGGALVVNGPQFCSLFVTEFLGGFKLCRGLTSLTLDLGKEFEEGLRVLLKHLFGADKTELSHFIEICKSLDLLVFLLKQHLNKEHLSFLLNELISVLSVLRSLYGHIEAGSLSLVDLVLDVWVDCQLCRWDVCLT